MAHERFQHTLHILLITLLQGVTVFAPRANAGRLLIHCKLDGGLQSPKDGLGVLTCTHHNNITQHIIIAAATTLWDLGEMAASRHTGVSSQQQDGTATERQGDKCHCCRWVFWRRISVGLTQQHLGVVLQFAKRTMPLQSLLLYVSEKK